MAGYKTTALAYEPKLFITFDGDDYDETSRMYTDSPATILDESGFDNHGILHDSGAVSGYSGYRAGMPSVVMLEQFQQTSCAFGFYGRRPAAPNIYEKAYIEVPHSAASFSFPDNGKFTVMFLVRKEDVSRYRTQTNSYSNCHRPLIRKDGVFNIYMDYTLYSGEFLCAQIPGGEVITYQVNNADFHNRSQHITLTWNLTIADNGDKIGTATLYVNAEAVATKTVNYYDAYPNLNTPTSILIGGNQATIPDYGDRHTESCQLDQIAIYDKAFSGNTVGRMVRKTMSYRDMILYAKPSSYWECADFEDPNRNTLIPTAGSIEAQLKGGNGFLARGLPGPSQVPESTAVQSTNGGQIYFTYQYSAMSPVININQNYTIEFWFAASATTIASLFAMNGTARPFNGINLTMNMKNNQYRAGCFQLQETENEWITAEGNWNNGKEHHCAIIRRGGILELWLDGSLAASKAVTKTSSGAPGTASFFAAAPGRQGTDGWVSQIAWYPHALQESQITARANYRRIYKVRGQVTMRGIPYKANVRVYTHINGNLLTEVFSDPTGGDYLVELYDNRALDIMVLNSQDPTVRYRVYGPVTPSEYEDLPT